MWISLCSCWSPITRFLGILVPVAIHGASNSQSTSSKPRANNTKVQMLVDDEFCIKTIFRHGGNAILRHRSKRHRCWNRCRENNCWLPAITMMENEVSSRYSFQVKTSKFIAFIEHFKSQTGFCTEVLHMKHLYKNVCNGYCEDKIKNSNRFKHILKTQEVKNRTQTNNNNKTS